MPSNDVLKLDFRQFFILSPEIALALWGLLVLMTDLTVLRGADGTRRRQLLGWLTLLGIPVAAFLAFGPIFARLDVWGAAERLNFTGVEFLTNPDPVLFFGTLADDLLTELFNILFIALLGLVVRMSMAWSFTEDWGEYYALLCWSAVGMMLLTASEELLTLFLTLETMTICLYLAAAFEKDRRRSAEGALKYFVYGSVSSALFLFGLSLIYGLTGSTQIDSIRQALNPVYGVRVGLAGNVAGMSAVLLMLVGFGFKVAAVPFHQWAPDAYEGAPAPVTAWIATGSKVASFVALMKVLLHALGPWSSPADLALSPGWIGLVAVISAASMTFGNFAALAQRNLKRMLAYSSIAHAGYMLVGVAAAGVSSRREESAGSVLYYLVIYAFSNVGAFAVAAWLARDRGSDEIDDLNGLGKKHPFLATCVLILMLSLIGMPPLAGFFGKLYMFMEALNEPTSGRLTLIWLVALGLLNSVVSAFYYVRVLKAMFLREPAPGRPALGPATTAIALPIVLGTAIVIGFGLFPDPLVSMLKGAAVPMLSSGGMVPADTVLEDQELMDLLEATDPAMTNRPADLIPDRDRSGRPREGDVTPPNPTPAPGPSPMP
jgi:NADH-quinone oxidoreductase subunit N